MTTQRTFIYNDTRLPDPGTQYDNDQVRQFLASHYFPELAHCDIQVGDEADGKVDITFVKRATTKGSHALHLQRLQTLPASALQPMTILETLPLQAGDQPTLAEIIHEDNSDWITDLAERAMATQEERASIGLQCHQQLLAHPLSAIPLGF